MKPFTIIIVIVFWFTATTFLYSKEKVKKKVGNYSEYQGEMNWKSAKAKCANAGMRLPTRTEFESAYKAKNTVSWKKDGYWFWTSDEYSNTDAFYFDIGVGVAVDQLKEEVNHVRCIH